MQIFFKTVIKIAVFGPWWDNLQQANEKYLPLSPNEKGVWGNIELITNISEADYYIILQSDSKISAKLSAKKKIYFQREPDVVEAKEITQNYGAYFSTYLNSYHFSAWWLGRSYDELKKLKYVSKDLAVSTVLSNKEHTDGHKLRVNFIKELNVKKPKLMDIYGSINQVLKNSNLNYNGWRDNKFDMVWPYTYSFAAENCSQPNYFTEKIVDAYLAWSMPIYWGCPNISKYFPAESFHSIDIKDVESSIREIEEICKMGITKLQIDAIAHARELILDKYNFWPTMHEIITTKLNTQSYIKTWMNLHIPR